ncbi:MAG: helix-turn-helix domain-containing protein [Acidimicrobiia bacterium]
MADFSAPDPGRKAGMAEPWMRDRGDLRYRALADPTRRRLLRILDDAGEEMHPADLAARVGLHVNTVRGHLDLMEKAGLVERKVVSHAGPGRPHVVFRSRPRDARSPESEGYRFLAEILASSIHVDSDDPRRTAQDAGRAWGRFLATRPPSSAPLPPARVLEQIVTTLAELGFGPEATAAGDQTEILLHGCPFREMARARGDIVCSVHEGLLRGMLDEMGGSVRMEALEPFVEPSLCIARVSSSVSQS